MVSRLWLLLVFLISLGYCASIKYIPRNSSIVDVLNNPDLEQGDTFQLEAGIHFLSSPVTITKRISLIGGPSTIICSLDKSNAFEVTQGSNFSISQITIRSCNVGLTIKDTPNHSITACSFQENEIALIVDNANIVVAETNFTNNRMALQTKAALVDVRGGAIQSNANYLSNSIVSVSGGQLLLNGVQVYNNTGNSTRVISLQQRAVGVFSHSTFSFNLAPYGGTLFTEKTTSFTLLNCTFMHNTAYKSGGAIYSEVGAFQIKDCQFRENIALGERGGAVYVQMQSSLNISGSYFSFNQAKSQESRGGAIYLERGSTLTLHTSSFFNNSAITRAGAVYAERAAVLEIVTCKFENTSMINSGGAIFVEINSKISINDTTFSYNNVKQRGGAIFIEPNTTATMNNCNVTSNTASIQGGGVYVTSSSLFIMDSNFVDNNALDGGGLWAFYSTIDVISSSFLGNYARSSGGAMKIEHIANFSNLLHNFAAPTARILHSMLGNNRALNGSGVHAIRVAVMLENCVLHQNNATTGGGITLRSSQITITGTNVTHNKATQGGAALRIESDSVVLVQNTTIMYNTDSTHNVVLVDSTSTLLMEQTRVELLAPLSNPFCCNSEEIVLPSGQMCNYPPCTNCLSGCACPTQISVSSYTPSFNQTCSCQPYHSDEFCTTFAPEDCSTKNGGCDLHVGCNVYMGEIMCDPCPPGFTGSGSTKCVSLCGNDVCEPSVGENCLSCPLDCQIDAHCGMCDDGYCNSELNETCQNCWQDCLMCDVPKCDCNNHGICVNGFCECHETWSGPYCNVAMGPITLQFNNSYTPDGVIKYNSPHDLISFRVSIHSLSERNLAGDTIYYENLEDYEFSGTSSVMPNTTNTVWKFTATLKNKALIYIEFIEFRQENTALSFLNKTTTYPANTAKMSLRISDWPFRSLSSSLFVQMNDFSPNGGEKLPCSTSAGQNLRWTLVQINSTFLYAQFEPEALIDGIARTIKFEKTDSGIVSAILPHFWTSAEMDPRFSVLLHPEPLFVCGIISSDNSGGMELAGLISIVVICSLAGIAILVGSIYYAYRTRKQQKSWDEVDLKLKSSTLSASEK